MTNYTVAMESGHDYFVAAASEQDACREAERLAAVVHGVIDHAVRAQR